MARASARDARAHRPRRGSSCERALQDTGHHAATVEVLLGEVAREPAVSLVVGLDGRQRAHRLIHRAEAKQARGVGQPAGPGVLHHRRLPAGQVADGPVTGPAVHELDTVGLHAAEFAARRLDVAAVLLRCGADLPGLTYAPAKGAEAVAPFRVVLAQAHRQLE